MIDKPLRIKRALGKLKEVLLKKKVNISVGEDAGSKSLDLFDKKNENGYTTYQIVSDKPPLVFE